MKASPLAVSSRWLPMAADGRLLNPCRREAIASMWRDVTDLACQQLREIIGSGITAIYLRGSVAAATAQCGVADLDLVVVVREPLSRALYPPLNQWRLQLLRDHPWLRDIEAPLVVQGWLEGAPAARQRRFQLQTQAICWHGEDISRAWPPCYLSADLAWHLPQLARHLARARSFLAAARVTDEADYTRACHWILRRIVRAGFERVMLREGRYSRDIDLCGEAICRHQPEWASLVEQALLLAHSPRPDRDRVVAIIDQLGESIASHAEVLPREG
jgi:hypothetical protein